MQRRILTVAALAALAIAVPAAATSAAAKSKARPAPAVVFGAVTSQGYPVVVELSRTGRKVVNATIGLEVECQMPPDITLPDTFTNMTIGRSGRFKGVVALTRLPADPATGQPAIDFTASVSARVNKARTRITGTWQRRIVIHDLNDPTGVAVFDTCDSGPLRFTARQ